MNIVTQFKIELFYLFCQL